MQKHTISIDSISSIRLYLLSVPALFGFLLFAVDSDTLYWHLFLYGMITGILLVVLRITASFNPEKQTVTWKWGFIFPFITYRKKTYKDVAQVILSSKSQMENMYMEGKMTAAQTSNTYYRIYLVLKEKNKKIALINSENKDKLGLQCEKIAEALSFKEKPYGGTDKRQWCR